LLNCICHSGSDADRRKNEPPKPRQSSAADSGSVADADKVKDAAGDGVNVNVQSNEMLDVDDEEEKIPDWIRCSPADLYFKRDSVLILVIAVLACHYV